MKWRSVSKISTTTLVESSAPLRLSVGIWVAVRGSIEPPEALLAQMPNVRPPRTNNVEAGAIVSDAAPELSEARGFTTVREIAVGRGAVSGIAVGSDGGLLTVTHHGDDSVSLVNTNDAAAALTITDVDEPFAVAMSGRRAYVSSVAEGQDEILALDTESEYIVGAYPVAFSITDLAVSPNGRYLYAARAGADGADVAILDTATGKKNSVSIVATTVVRCGCPRSSPARKPPRRWRPGRVTWC